MRKYAKFVVALIGAAIVGANSFGWLAPADAQALTNAVAAAATAFGVYAVPNRP